MGYRNARDLARSLDDQSAASESSASLTPDPVGGVPAVSRQRPAPSKDALSTATQAQENAVMRDWLPTLDEFRRQFKDAVRVGLPLQKCLELGTVWTGMNKPATFETTKDCFRRAVRDALKAGMSLPASLAYAADQAAPQRIEPYRISGIGVPMADVASMKTSDPDWDKKIASTEKWLTLSPPGHVKEGQPLSQRTELGKISGDTRAFFRGAVKDALTAGKGYRKAIADALSEVVDYEKAYSGA